MQYAGNMLLATKRCNMPLAILGWPYHQYFHTIKTVVHTWSGNLSVFMCLGWLNPLSLGSYTVLAPFHLHFGHANTLSACGGVWGVPEHAPALPCTARLLPTLVCLFSGVLEAWLSLPIPAGGL